MSNVLIEKSKIDNLANAISNKSGESVPMTLTDMVSAVDGIETGGGGITPTGNINITSAGTTDVTNYATATVPQGDVYPMISWQYKTVSNARKFEIKPKSIIYTDYNYGTIGYIDDNYEKYGEAELFNAIAQNTTITPTESSQTIGGADTMLEGAVTVSAIPSNYVGSGITQRSSSDLTASGATVTVPSGYYASNATKSVANGTAGTPTATKGTVSNHSVSVTPSVTNTTGYITGSTKTGTAVTVSASELVSGDKSITANGNNIDVANYSTVSVNVSGGSSKNAQAVQGTTRTTSSSFTAIGAEMTVSKTGTYDVYWSAFRSSTTSSYIFYTQLYIDNVAYGTENTTWSNHIQNNYLQNVSLTQGQKIRVRGRNSRGNTYYIYAPTLVIIES